MNPKSSLFVAVALCALILAWPYRLFDSDAWSCKNSANTNRIEACTRAIKSAFWYFDTGSWAYANRASVYRKSGQPDLALADYNEAIRLDPRRSLIYYYRGIAYEQKKDLDHAIQDYSLALNYINTRKSSVTFKRNCLNHRAIAYKRKGDFVQSMADFNSAINVSPQDSDLFYNRGLLFRAMNDPDRAVADFTQAINGFNPANNSPADKRDYLTDRGDVYKIKGKPELAISDYDSAIALDATFTRAIKARARIAGIANP